MKRIIPYPFFLIAAVILDRVAISSTQIGALQSLRSLFLLLLFTTLVVSIAHYLTQDRHYSNFLVLMVWVMLLLYRYAYRLFKVNWPQDADLAAVILMLFLCGAYALLVNKRLWRSIRNPERLTYYFNIVFALLFSFQVVLLAKDIYNLLMTNRQSQTTAVSVLTEDIKLGDDTPPDIYVLVLDGYARQDVLESLYDHDNSGFIAQLETLGFFVAKKSHSNYVQTSYSMASFWNFDYLKPWKSSSDYAQYLLEPIENNRVFRLLNEIDYTTVSFEGELDYVEIKNSDKYLSSFLPFNKFERLLLMDSPLEPFSNTFNWPIPIPTYKTHAQRIRYELDTLKEIPTSIPGPKIVYAHIVLPHPPFVFDRNGNVPEDQQPYSLWDEISYTGGVDQYRNGYIEQLMFINTEIIGVLNTILANSESPPIILLMSDHGPASLFTWKLDKPGCLWERTSNLYAVFLPGHANSGMLSPSMSPVNTFRMIFNIYFDTELPLLEDKSYLMSWQQPTLAVDVTSMRDSMNGCTSPEK